MPGADVSAPEWVNGPIPGVRAARQVRSERSATAVLVATRELLNEVASAEFTFQDVSRRSGVSVGAICHRFGSKDNLVRIALAAMLKEFDAFEKEGFRAASRRAANLQEYVASQVKLIAEGWKRYGVARKTLARRAESDESLRTLLEGQVRRSDAASAQSLLQFRKEFGSGAAEGKAQFVIGVMRSTLALDLKLETQHVPQTIGEDIEARQWLVRMCVGFLMDNA